jgi:hypothetical protein
MTIFFVVDILDFTEKDSSIETIIQKYYINFVNENDIKTMK